MQPATQDLIIYQGDSFDFFFRLRERVWDPGTETYIGGAYIDLTGCTGKAQIRSSTDDDTVQAEFAASLSNQITTPGGVLLLLTPTQTTDLLPPLAQGGVWDVQLTDGAGEVHTYIAGKVTVTPQVTR